MFPRYRRLRQAPWIRDLVAEVSIAPAQLIQPYFLVDGNEVKEEISALPGQFRYSFDTIVEALHKAQEAGIKMVALFPKIDAKLKDEQASYSLAENNFFINGLVKLKKQFPNIGFMVDVALDPYTSHGHDGILGRGDVDNDATVAILAQYSTMIAEAGVEVVAPSDMMDGRVAAIRERLDVSGFQNTMICSYAAKFCSNFYGPFRAAVGSQALGGNIDKSGYQLDFRNSKEALKEVIQDSAEGADMIIIKPGLPYLDVICRVEQICDLPIIAYQVSGEYAMLKLAAREGLLDFNAAYLETLISLQRAGSNAIITYGATEIAPLL